MGNKVIDMTGQRFGRLTVIELHDKTPGARWACVCDCGTQKIIAGGHLRDGSIKSCGCLHSELSSARELVHGKSDTREYRSWSSMLKRCTNPNDKSYKYYGGRGISICERWYKFENFLEDMGPRPDGCTLDRIQVDGNYEPSNCRWTVWSEQMKNRRKFTRNT